MIFTLLDTFNESNSSSSNEISSNESELFDEGNVFNFFFVIHI